MEKEIVEEIVRKRVQENQKLFTKEELKFIENNMELMKKLYLLGLTNGKEIYETKSKI